MAFLKILSRYYEEDQEHDECDEDTAFSFTAHTAPLCDASHAAADRLSGAMKQSDEDVPH